MFWNPAKLREWHEQLLDYIVTNPRATLEELAEFYGAHPGTVRQVINSDIFQARLKERRATRNSKVDETVLEKIDRVAKKSLDLMAEKLDKDGTSLPLEEIRETSESVLRALGYASPGPTRPGANPGQQNTFIFVGKEDLATARELMRRRQEPPLLLLEGEGTDQHTSTGASTGSLEGNSVARHAHDPGTLATGTDR